MQSVSRNVLTHYYRKHSITSHASQTRYISLTGAIERGIRKGKRDGLLKSYDPTEETQFPREHTVRNSEWESTKSAPREGMRRPDALRTHQTNASKTAPHAIPYTQPNSEFIYGTFGVSAAIAARRRDLYRLYVHTPDTGRSYPADEEVARKARGVGIEVQKVTGPSWLRLLDKASEGRPHNGYLMETSCLPIPFVGSLRPYREDDKQLDPDFEVDSTQDMFGNNSSSSNKELQASKKDRSPFYLFLDQILDPGNLGAIIRSAYFFGVDGIILLEHNTAPLTGVAVKASAGASEYVPMMRVRNEVSFINKSQENGWRFVGAMPESYSSLKLKGGLEIVRSPPASVSECPTVLVLGSEGEGVRPKIARLLDGTVSIGTPAQHPGIDSLNVSVAASILMRDFLSGRATHIHSRE